MAVSNTMQMYRQKISVIHSELGIPSCYENDFSLKLQQEAIKLIEIGTDIYGRLQRLTPPAASAWQAMKLQADNEGVALSVVSAFRSVDKQIDIIRNKIIAGQEIPEILQACAAPGYSEHHTGRALDLTSAGCEPLSEMFENTVAFNWLTVNASVYSFRLSYPRDNKAGIVYEPWHWAFNPA